MKTAILFVSLVMLIACTTGGMVWVRDGYFTQDTFNRDSAQCDYQVAASTQGVDPGYGMVVQELDLAIRRGKLLKMCMVAKGWRLERQP